MVGLVCKAVVVRVMEINHHGWTVQGRSGEGDGD